MKKILNLTAITILSSTATSHLTNTKFKENNNKTKNNNFQKNASTKKTTNNDLKANITTRTDAQLFEDVTKYLASFTADDPFYLVGFGNHKLVIFYIKLKLIYKLNLVMILRELKTLQWIILIKQ